MALQSPTTLPSIIFLLLVSLVVTPPSATAQSTASLVSVFPEFSFRDHPLLTLPQFENFTTQPVILCKYFFYFDNARNSERAIFSPASSTYAIYKTTLDPTTYPSPTILFDKIDTLFMPNIPADRHNQDRAATVILNRRARVFILVVAHKFHRGETDVRNVRGVPSAWKLLGAVRIQSDPMLGEAARWGDKQPKMPELAAAFEIPLPEDLTINLAHPRNYVINGEPGVQYHLLFSPPSTDPSSFPLSGFDPPAFPASFRAPLNMSTRVTPKHDPPIPNTDCPQWLHDLWVTEDRYTYSTRQYWRTWHPMIDPVYWCYYDHEHGSFPGNYRPKFHYTPSRTPDRSTPTGHQFESHEGFKIFAFQQPGDGRVVVAVIHMHLTLARRFTTRFHTFIFSVHRVISEKKWKMEMELQMKMDFGPATVRFSNMTREPFNAEGFAIEGELRSRMRSAARLFNAVNLDDDFPASLDKRVYSRGDPRRGREDMMLGFYEKWRGPLNTCSRSTSKYNDGFVFDVRDPPSGMRVIDGSIPDRDNMQMLNGTGKRRLLIVNPGNVQIDDDFCEFDNVTSVHTVDERGSDGVFFTDAKFTRIVEAGTEIGKVRQFIEPGFERLKLMPGKMGAYVTTEEPWSCVMAYGGQDNRLVEHVERSFTVSKN